MKNKWGLWLMIMLLLVGSGCSPAQEVSNSVDYAKAALDYVNKVIEFKSATTDFIQKGDFNQNARKAFLPKVDQMKKDLAAFEALNAPVALRTIRDQLKTSTSYLNRRWMV
jgi:hypothetical protein